MRHIRVTSFFLILLLLLSGCTWFEQDSQPNVESPHSGDAEEQTEPYGQADHDRQRREDNEKLEEEIPLSEHHVQLMVVGDIMMHSPQIDAGKTEDGYDFFPFFSEVKPLFDSADLVLGNLETTFGGADKGYTGYPLFSSPDELADALKLAGFDVVTTANNHSLDRGAQGLRRTIDVLEEAGLKTTGTFRSAEEREQILVMEQNEITIAILAYTYGTNGIPVPQGEEYLVNLLNEENMERDIALAKEKADFVVVCIHFGAEYQTEPNQEQKMWVDKLFEWGADLVFGSHPHVLQPYEIREWLEKDHRRRGVVIYSLGNFISNQRDHPRDIGGILSVHLRKVGDQASIENVDFIPTYVHRYWEHDQRVYQVLPMKKLVDERSFPHLSESDYNLLEQRFQQTLDHMTPVEQVIQENG